MGPNPSAEVWLRIDEIGELVDSLEHVSNLSKSLQTNVLWKWVILALHNALQGACTCALRGKDTAGITVLAKDSAKAVWHWLDVESRQEPCPPMPTEKLASLMELFKRVQRVRFLEPPYTLIASDQTKRDVWQLNELRNDFMHFVPKGFSLEVGGMPRIVENCCDTIEYLAVRHPTFSHHLAESQVARMRCALLAIRAAMHNYVKR